jgi:hypothetical protein
MISGASPATDNAAVAGLSVGAATALAKGLTSDRIGSQDQQQLSAPESYDPD